MRDGGRGIIWVWLLLLVYGILVGKVEESARAKTNVASLN